VFFLSNRSSEKVFGSNSGWLFTDAAESLFVVSIVVSVICKDTCLFPEITDADIGTCIQPNRVFIGS